MTTYTAVRLYLLLWPGIGPALLVAGTALLTVAFTPEIDDQP